MTEAPHVGPNGTLATVARLMSALGVPSAAVLLGWLGVQIWGELGKIRETYQTTISALATLSANVTNADRRLGRLEDRVDALIVDRSRTER